MDVKPLLDRFAAGPAALAARIRGLTPEQLTYRPFPEAWTVHEHVVHLADSEINASVRLRKLLAESGAAVDVFDQEKWVSSLDYHHQPLDRALALFRLLREIAVDLLKTVKEAAWDANHIRHPERGKVTLRDWLTTYTEHVDSHLGYVERNLKMWAESRAGK